MTDINIDDLAPCPFCGKKVESHYKDFIPEVINDSVAHYCCGQNDIFYDVPIEDWPRKERKTIKHDRSDIEYLNEQIRLLKEDLARTKELFLLNNEKVVDVKELKNGLLNLMVSFDIQKETLQCLVHDVSKLLRSNHGL